MKSSAYALALVLVTTQLVSVHCIGWAVLEVAASALSLIPEIADRFEVWSVEVHNDGRHDVHLWCASKDDRIGDGDGIWVKPGNKIVWAFRRSGYTQFWCTMDRNGQREGWDVYVGTWKDAPNPTKWSIRDDGVYDQWKNRRWRDLNS